MTTRSTDSTNAPRTQVVKDSHFDLVIVGGGSAAFAAAIKTDE